MALPPHLAVVLCQASSGTSPSTPALPTAHAHHSPKASITRRRRFMTLLGNPKSGEEHSSLGLFSALSGEKFPPAQLKEMHLSRACRISQQSHLSCAPPIHWPREPPHAPGRMHSQDTSFPPACAAPLLLKEQPTSPVPSLAALSSHIRCPLLDQLTGGSRTSSF